MLDLLGKFKTLDKITHFLAGYGVCLTLLLCFNVFTSFVISLIAAFAKEIYDYFHKDKHTPDIYDVIAAAIGSIVAILVFKFFSIF